jgi:cathepsin B
MTKMNFLTSAILLGGACSSTASVDRVAGAYDVYLDVFVPKLTDSERSMHLGRFRESIARGEKNLGDVFISTLPAIRQETVASVRRAVWRLWEPSIDDMRFSNATIHDARIQCGTILNSRRKNELPIKAINSSDPIPESFDARSKWPECGEYIGHALDQSNCGSCWSFSTTTALEDRLCIHTSGKYQTHLSPLDTLSCCNEENGCESFGCNGGDPASAWEWFVSEGVVTGGEYGDDSTCKPYAFPKCAHHVNAPDLQPCNSGKEYETPSCLRECTNKAYKQESYSHDKHKSVEAYTVPNHEEAIKREIMTNGPVSAAFMVYEDFLTYKGGIYHHITGNSVGGHAVKLIGWGKDETTGTKYWLLVNSWNPSWGEGGLFRMGIHEGGIMDEITAGIIKPTNENELDIHLETE